MENAIKVQPSMSAFVGIIYPPPLIRNVVDKTAEFVARNGLEFESKIRLTSIDDDKFDFINPGNLYNSYYRHKIHEIVQEPEKSKEITTPGTTQNEILKKIEEDVPKLKDPPADFEFIADPPTLSGLDLDTVKLTAQFVAKNGKKFLTNLMAREQRNSQFDFLRPQHRLFNYFTSLLEQYAKILKPPTDILTKLKKESDSKYILKQVQYRAEWARREERQQKCEEEKAEKERVAYSQIDWHDFAVVEEIDYQPDDSGVYQPPTTAEEVWTRVLEQERSKESGDVIDMDVDLNDEIEVPDKEIELEQPQILVEKDERQIEQKVMPLPPIPEKVIIRNYDPKTSKPVRRDFSDFVISPLTGEKIPTNKIQDHLRFGMLDPEWSEQKNKSQQKMQQDAVFAQGSDIEGSLKRLAERRTDIFGSGVEETEIGLKIGEAEPEKTVPSVPSVSSLVSKSTISAPAKPAVAKPIVHVSVASTPNIAPQPFILPHRPPQLMPQTFPIFPPQMMPSHFVPPPHMSSPFNQPTTINSAPLNKKPKEDCLINEQDFLRMNPRDVIFFVHVPDAPDKTEWNLKGQSLSFKLPLTDTISVVKAKLFSELGIPPGKQKLQYDGMFCKDACSLAYYNLINNAALQLQLKERGGRKR